MTRYVDPSPAGWVYGFPKEDTYNPAKDGTREDWLEKEGYPVDRYPYYVLRFIG